MNDEMYKQFKSETDPMMITIGDAIKVCQEQLSLDVEEKVLRAMFNQEGRPVDDMYHAGFRDGYEKAKSIVRRMISNE